MTNLKLLLKMAAALLALLLLFVAFVVFVNRIDRSPSESAIKLQGIAASDMPVADRDNAYVYVMGFAAQGNADVMSEGVARVDSLRKSMEIAGPSGIEEMPGEQRDSAGPVDNVQLIERYERLLEFRKWREIWPGEVRSPSAPFGKVHEAQRQMYLKALVLAGKGDAAECRRILEKDYRFWRMVLAESASADVKMIAARSIEQHFEMGNLVVSRFPPALTMIAMPDGWREPLSERERSLAKMMANEWIVSDISLGQAVKDGKWRSEDDHPDDSAATLFGRLLFQPQATSNANADRMLRVVDLFASDYAAIPRAAGIFLVAYGNAKKGGDDVGVYNPVGKMQLNKGGMDEYTAFGFRVANLEGMRRVALLASQLRSSGVKGDEVAERIRTSDLRDPYDGNEFAWDQAHNSLLLHRTLEGKPDFKIVY